MMSKKLSFILGLIFIVSFLVKCMDSKNIPADPRGADYAGAGSCRSCHQAVYDSFRLTSHHAATAPGDQVHVKGSFLEGKNSFAFDGNRQVKMEKRGGRLYQVLYIDGKEKESHPFDISFGSKNAQTWLYWSGNNTYQLPVSFYTSANAWGTSPGYSILYPSFDRLIGRNCFECHSSHIGFLHTADSSPANMNSPQKREEMDRRSLVTGIDCERCHGPAREHVIYHEQNPGQQAGRFITRIMGMSRQQQLDACAVCHSGNDRVKKKSRFAFRPGDTLSHFFGSLIDSIIKTEPDVHGNQYGLLTESRCFTQSLQLTCNTCHDPHRDNPGSLAIYSAKCVGCHQQGSPAFCTVQSPSADVLVQNCIDCHMPNQASSAISFQLSGSTQRYAYYLRTHKIAVYQTESK